ncbi:hypothetical protein GJW-30_1_04437 [Variibacter gotjawalensis]|uniref:Uncharacterized protein n=1 Tax=Variibacter gotjawalensis TaxID=1333996 RepID=A0A0S3Q163_9BRAD|nr:hypothetical protein [Variibacter gotjawalensis]NIK47720.1 hypothetical protein [Variibacter gotjawalensis]RZS49612.1 hypothetical protein EV661_2048 [Variibacter gotjawalensis]BAT61875.1 hypothetical protein GJW-30_1_04437 [Variibacter gotjawalensis]
MTDVPFHADLQHNIPARQMSRYQVLSHDGYRIVTTVVMAASDADAIAACSAFFAEGALEISQDGRLVHTYAQQAAA